MKKFVRVFLKGEPVRWFDFQLADNANLHLFVMQMRFEGFAINSHGYIVESEVKACMLIETASDLTKAQQWLGGVQTVGQA